MQLRSGNPDGWECDKSRGRAGRGVLSGWQGRGASIPQVRGARSFTEMVRVQTMTTTMAACAGDRHVHPASRAACKSASRWAMPMSRAGQPRRRLLAASAARQAPRSWRRRDSSSWQGCWTPELAGPWPVEPAAAFICKCKPGAALCRAPAREAARPASLHQSLNLSVASFARAAH